MDQIKFTKIEASKITKRMLIMLRFTGSSIIVPDDECVDWFPIVVRSIKNTSSGLEIEGRNGKFEINIFKFKIHNANVYTMELNPDNAFHQTETELQLQWFCGFWKAYKDKIIRIALTRGGYLVVDFNRASSSNPYGSIIIAQQGGRISSSVGKSYDKRERRVMNGFLTDYKGQTRI